MLASKYLKQNGYLYMVHRSERLDDIIYYARINNIPVKEIQLITTKIGENPIIILVKCCKNGKSRKKKKKEINISNLKSYKNIFS